MTARQPRYSKEVRQDMALAIQRIAFEISRFRENDAHERDTIALRLETRLQQFERRLPSGTSGEEETTK